MDVIGYGDAVPTTGLNMLYGPGNDLVSATAMTAAGAHLILFSTGRGTPFSAPAPTLKISTNTPLAQKKSGWMSKPSTRPSGAVRRHRKAVSPPLPQVASTHLSLIHI